GLQNPHPFADHAPGRVVARCPVRRSAQFFSCAQPSAPGRFSASGQRPRREVIISVFMNDIISSRSGNPEKESATAQHPQTAPKHLPAEEKKLGVALVGLGTYSEKELAPALMETSYCRLAGVVSGSAEKREKWSRLYQLDAKNLYSYDNFDEIATNRDIDIVYVVLPNALHAEYVIRAARAGKHVICEKPMATTSDDGRRMLDACREARVKLSIGYRLHFDPFNQEMMRLGQGNLLGSIERVIAKN